jgi:8-oxo-dGTP pyrophosphatase MutT (NUDIX family)
MANTPRFGRSYERTRYVVGFAFNGEGSRVALITKTHGPAGSDMPGTLNGLGGQVNPRESNLAAMRREFLQEAGTMVTDWTQFAILEGDTYRVACFRCFLGHYRWRSIATGVHSRTDEEVNRYSTVTLTRFALYPDVAWLIALALDNSPRAVVRVDRRGI